MKSRIENLFFLAALIAALSLTPAARVTAQTFTTLHSFTGTDGGGPVATLILSGNTLFGTAYEGGSGGAGTVFALNTDGSGFTTLYNFTGGSDGGNPGAGLVLLGDTLYGTARAGGSSFKGTVFALNTNGPVFTTLYSFPDVSDGANPNAGLVLSGNTLFGTAASGGTDGSGTVFAINTDGSGFTTLYTFTGGSDGAQPNDRLILSGNTLYGTAWQGGNSGDGTVFAINTNGPVFTTLYTFTGGSDGANPWGELILSGSTLYGTASSYFTGDGTVFAINTNGPVFTTLHGFTGGSDGATPWAGLVLSGNTLYGTAYYGGSSGDGTVFAINTNGTGFTTLYSFSGESDGAKPQAGLILSGNTLYGAAFEGGSSEDGTVFSLALLDHFAISAISSPQAVGIGFPIATITAQDADNNTVTTFGGTVTFGGTAGVTGTSGTFSSGVLSLASVTPTVPGSNLTVTVNDGFGHNGSAVIATVYEGNPGTIEAGDTTWGPGGNYPWALDQASSGQGTIPGWVLLNITGTLTVTATAEDPFVIQVNSLQQDDTPGPVYDFNQEPSGYTWTIATANDGITGFDPSFFTVATTNFENFTGGGTFSLVQSGNSVNLVFAPHACAPGETTLGYEIVAGQAQLYFANRYGLSAVQAITLDNCTITGGTAYGFGFPSGTSVGPVGFDSVSLPNGTTNLMLIAARTAGTGAGDALVNASVSDECSLATQFDPVIARLIAQAGARLWQTYSAIPSAEHFVVLANGTPGLRSVKLLVNGWTYNLGTLADGQTVVVDIGASMNPGASNSILVMAGGGQGATANILIADAPNGPLVPVQPQVEAPVLSFVQEGGGVVLSWPAPAGFFTLQGRASLDPATGWQDLVVNQQESQGWSFVAVQSHTACQFFRLRK
jgi:uncharacterized repeat protein (TIGR03803 family)